MAKQKTAKKETFHTLMHCQQQVGNFPMYKPATGTPVLVSIASETAPKPVMSLLEQKILLVQTVPQQYSHE